MKMPFINGFKDRFRETVKQELRESITEEVKTSVMKELKEEMDPYDGWGIPFRLLSKNKDSQSRKRTEKLQKAFQQWEDEPEAASGLEYMVAYILGEGVQFNSPVPIIDQRLNQFWKKNNLELKQFAVVRTGLLDGELILYFEPLKQMGQIPIFASFDASEITYIAINPDDQNKVDYYHRHWEKLIYPAESVNTAWAATSSIFVDENIPGDRILHFKFGELLNLERGRGILSRSHYWIDEFKEFVRIRKALHKSKSSLVLDVEVDTSDENILRAEQQKFNNFAKYDETGNLLNTMPVGQPIVHNKQEVIKFMNPDIGSTGAFEDGRLLNKKIALSLMMPEFMLSDGYTSNLATALAQQSPTVKAMVLRQKYVKLMFKAIFDKILTELMNIKDLKESYEIETSEGKVTKDTLELYTISLPEIAVDDLATLATAIAQLVKAEVISREYGCEVLGQAWATEKERIKNEKAEGFVSAPDFPAFGKSPLPVNLGEEMSKDELEKIRRLSTECRQELIESFRQYQKDLENGIVGAKEQFVTRHQEIMQRHLTKNTSEGYADKILQAVK